MRKPAELRAFLTAANPALAANPDRLSIFVDKGRVRCTGRGGLSHEYEYTLTLFVADFSGTPDSIVLPVLAWLRTAQPELFENRDKRDSMLSLDVEVLQNDLVDLSITLPLTERVAVKPDPQHGGKLRAEHLAEPPHPDLPTEAGEWAIYLDGEQIATLPYAAWAPAL